MNSSLVSIAAIVVAVSLAGLFAGAETGIYQLSRVRLQLAIEKKRFLSVVLGASLRDRPALLLSILLGTNLAHYVATSVITYTLLASGRLEHTAELFAAFITVPTLFVFSELLPKNIFFYRPDSLMPCCGPFLFVFHKLFTWSGIVPLLKLLSTVPGRLTGSGAAFKAAMSAGHPRHIGAIVRDTEEEGILSPVQTEMINRLISISNLTIRSVMTSIAEVQMVDVNSDKSVLLDRMKEYAFTCLPVYDRLRGNIIGFVNIYDCLSSGQEFTNLHDFIRQVRKLPAETLVTDAIDIMRREKEKIVLVTLVGHLGREKPIGIVTMKDLVEELLGELAEW